jgi:Na+-transporting NADH:ubiquinone oxidoreductase subunit A
MLRSGAWPFLVQRPYGTIADPQATPKAIFISGFDTAPLAADVDYTVNNEHEPFQVGVNALQKLTAGQVHLSLCADYPMSSTFRRLKGLEVHHFKGPHPSGNVGVQIHHIDPISKGDVVWTIRPQHVVALGKLLTSGVYDVTRVVALVGSEVKRPRYYRIAAGASLGCLSEFVRDGGQGKRVISGNVLTGADVGADGYLGFYDSEVTVIPEGRYYEALGWLRLRLRKFSMSRSYFSWLMPAREYAPDTNRNGERSPFVLTGQYERVLPMDILPVYLLKAIMAEDLPRMEQLGIYEVVEEDLALCEFVCASKVNVQQLLRRGISLMMAAGYPKVAQ